MSANLLDPPSAAAPSAEERFIARLTELNANVSRWAEAADWTTRVYRKPMDGADGGRFDAPALRLQNGPVRLLLDPAGYGDDAPAAAADLYVMPDWDQGAYLTLEDDRWSVRRVRDGLREGPPEPLDRETFLRTLEAVVSEGLPDAAARDADA